MDYPRTPSFANVFWYNAVLNDGSVWLCSTTGLEFIYELQRVLQEAGIESAPSYDGVSAGSSDIEADGIWGPTTQRVLYLAATRPGISVGIPTAFITGIESDGRRHIVGTASVYTAIYLIMSLSANSGLFIESGTSAGIEILRVQAFAPPQWGVRPPAVGVHNPPRNITCVLQVPSPNPGVSTVPEGTPAEPAVPAPGTSASPVPLAIPVGPPATRVDVSVPPGRQPTTVTQEGITIGPILVAAGVLAVIVWGASEVMKARQNPFRDMSRDLFSRKGLDAAFREQIIRYPLTAPKYIELSKPEARRLVDHYLDESTKMPPPGYELMLLNASYGESPLILQNMSGSFQITRRR